MFEKVLHFLAYNFSECSLFLNFKKQKEPIIDRMTIADIIVKTAVSISQSAMEALNFEQQKQKGYLENDLKKVEEVEKKLR